MEKLGEVVVKPRLPEEELCREIGDCEVLIVRSSTRVTRRVIEAGKKLKMIARAGVGIDNIDVKAAEERGIKVVYAPEASKTAVAELVLGLMLCWARKIPQAYRELKEGRWEKEKFVGTELKGKTLGVVGVGRIGGEVALKALAFGMRVLGYDLVRREEMEREGVKYVDLPTLLRESDFVTLHVPLTPQTERMIGERELSLMKPTAVLVNTSRGRIVDERALLKALREGRNSGGLPGRLRGGAHQKPGTPLPPPGHTHPAPGRLHHRIPEEHLPHPRGKDKRAEGGGERMSQRSPRW
jgi:D-3-phosphoglycerate dehydrogenase